MDFAPYTDLVRKHSEALMPDVAEVMRMARVSDGQGGFVTELTVVATTKCRVRPISGEERQAASQTTTVLEAKAFLPWAVEVKTVDKIRVGGPTGVKYEIKAVLPRSAGHSPHREVLVTRVA